MKLVEVVTTTEGLEVTNFAIKPLPPGGTRLIGPTLSNTLKEEGFRAKIINATIPYPSIDYRELSLPPMSKADMKTAMAREARRDIKFPPEELVFDYEVVGESEEKGVRRIEILMARAQSKDIEALFSMAKEFKLRFSALTVAPAVLLNLLRMRGGDQEETLAVVHIGTDKGTIIILHQGSLRFPREFPLRPGTAPTELSARVVGEVKRSLLFAKQRARGLMVKKIFLLGEIIEPSILVQSIISETGVQAELYAPLALDLSPLGETVQEFRQSLPKLSIPIGLAWSGPEHSRLNLMSQHLAALKKLTLAKVIVISVGALLAVLLTAGYLYLGQKTGPYRRDYERLRRELATLRPHTHDMKEMQKERDLQDARLAFIQKMQGPTTPWGEILRTISLSVPSEMFLHSMKIKEAEEGWMLRLRGEATGRDAALVQKRFNEFFSLLLTCPSLDEGVIESFTINPVRGPRRVEASKLEFTIRLRVKSKETPGGNIKG